MERWLISIYRSMTQRSEMVPAEIETARGPASVLKMDLHGNRSHIHTRSVLV